MHKKIRHPSIKFLQLRGADFLPDLTCAWAPGDGVVANPSDIFGCYSLEKHYLCAKLRCRIVSLSIRRTPSGGEKAAMQRGTQTPY